MTIASGTHRMRGIAHWIITRPSYLYWCAVELGRTLKTSWRGILRQLLFFGILAAIAVFWGLAVVVMEINAFFLAFSLIASVFIFYDFRIGVVMLVVFMPISSSTLFPHEIFGITGLNPLNFLLLATFLSCLLQSQFRPLPDKFVTPRVLFVYVVPIVFAGALGSRHVGDIPAYLSLLGDMRYDSAGGYFRDVAVKPLFLVLYSVLIGVAVHRSASPKKFFAPLLISIWVMSLMVVGFFLATGADFGVLASERARNFLSPLGMHANDLGRLYATAYALLLFTWARSTAVELKVVLLASMGLVFVALLLTFSRGAFFSFIAVNLLYLYWSRRLKTMLVGGLLGAVVILAMPGAISYRLTSGIGQGANAVTAGRVDEIWMPLLPELLRSPIYGNGLSSILWSDAMQTQSILAVAHPHNAYLGVLLDMGFAGLVAMAIFYWYLWRGFRTLAFDQTLEPAQRGFFEGAAAGLLSFLIAGMAGSSLTPAPEQVYLWLSAGAMFGIMSRKRQTQSARDEPATLKKYPAARVRHGFA